MSRASLRRLSIAVLPIALVALSFCWAKISSCWTADWRNGSVIVVSLASAIFWALSAGLSFETPADVDFTGFTFDVSSKFTNLLAAVLTGAAVIMQANYSSGCPVPSPGKAPFGAQGAMLQAPVASPDVTPGAWARSIARPGNAPDIKEV